MSETGDFESAAREMTRWERWKWRIQIWCMRVRDKFPHLVWRGDEIDCRVTWREDKLPDTGDQSEALRAFFGGPLRDLEIAMHKAGVSFDTGLGLGGRDWEWDFSLQGPISVTFKSRATKPERRRAKSRPKLIVNNLPAA